MDVTEAVRAHYGRGDLVPAILDWLREQGVDPDQLQVVDLFRIDQLHAGFAPATRHLLAALEVSAAGSVLDVGCGIGGAVRLAAHEYGAWAVGVDLSPGFVAAAEELSARVGLADRVAYAVTDGTRLPFDDASFDAATMIHVGMNVADKPALFREVRRVLVPDGRFGVYDQMRTGDGPLPYPLPWAVDEATSFVATPAEYEAALAAAGFRVTDRTDRTDAVAGSVQGASTGSGRGLPVAVLGPQLVQQLQNNIAAARGGLLGAVQILATAG